MYVGKEVVAFTSVRHQAPGWWGGWADEEKADSPSLPQMNKGQSGLVLVRVVVVLIIPILCPCPRPPTPTQHHAAVSVCPPY